MATDVRPWKIPVLVERAEELLGVRSWIAEAALKEWPTVTVTVPDATLRIATLLEELVGRNLPLTVWPRSFEWEVGAVPVPLMDNRDINVPETFLIVNLSDTAVPELLGAGQFVGEGVPLNPGDRLPLTLPAGERVFVASATFCIVRVIRVRGTPDVLGGVD